MTTPPDAPGGLDEKERCLRERLAALGGVVVAYSGGVDSTYLLAMAVETLEDRALAVTVRSDAHPASETASARQLAAGLGAAHREIHADVLAVEAFRQNSPDRCYHCKREILAKLRAIADAEGFCHVVEGSIVDDRTGYRPGRRAVEEAGVLSPLEDCGFTKADVRLASRRRGLSTWNRPSSPCLATRFPYGTELTREALGRVERAEAGLAALGLFAFRVRAEGELARIEISPDAFAALVGPLREEAVAAVKGAGFGRVALDLEGYRTVTDVF